MVIQDSLGESELSEVTFTTLNKKKFIASIYAVRFLMFYLDVFFLYFIKHKSKNYVLPWKQNTSPSPNSG